MTYTCPECGKSGQAEYESQFVRKAEFWKAILHCNRCADFLHNLSRLTASVEKLCVGVWQFHSSDKVKSEARESLIALTKKISRHVCDHYRLVQIWEPDFVEQLLDHPRKATFIVRHYRQEMRKLATQQMDHR